ncbi:MAG: 5-formyltetrahydrofolate cyclo-ligase [Marinosulfonomonas sp.]|nr:5-formyltetrahydrofolate cyclo-ligase [Marinosulfonomonas sp.]
MEDIAALKKTARKQAYTRRKAAMGPDRNRKAVAHLLTHLKPLKGKIIAGYMAIRSEVDPLDAMTELTRSGPVCVPVVVGAGQALEFRQWTPGCAMEKGAFGAMIPLKSAVLVPEVIILPLVAFDPSGIRLGYGGGFYDRTLQALRANGPLHTVGFAFQAQQSDALPSEPTDQRLDCIVTDQGTLRF